MDKHDQGFFGQRSALLFNSGDRSEPYAYLKCIKKTPNGWEKPSNQEGKTVKFSLLELICLYDVFSGTKQKWSTVHQFQQVKTSISVAWNKTPEEIWVAVGSYKKKLQYPETMLFCKLLGHIIEEKVEFSTTSRIQQEEAKKEGNTQEDWKNSPQYSTHPKQKSQSNRKQSNTRESYNAPPQPNQTPLPPYNAPPQPNQTPLPPYNAPPQPYQGARQPNQTPQPPYNAPQNPQTTSRSRKNYTGKKKHQSQHQKHRKPVQQLKQENTTEKIREVVQDVSRIEAKVSNKTDKAILLVFQDNQEYWLPKSAIVKGNVEQGENNRPLLIKNWILKSKKIIA